MPFYAQSYAMPCDLLSSNVHVSGIHSKYLSFMLSSFYHDEWIKEREKEKKKVVRLLWFSQYFLPEFDGKRS